jgi:hypothetical protein
MQIILNNPYRTAGILVGATAKEQERQIRRLIQYIEAEQLPHDDFSFPELGEIDRTIESINDAASKLNLDSDKMNAALFWFYNGNAITDEPAFDDIKDGNTDAANEIWRKLVYNSVDQSYNEVTKKNASAFHNLSTLYLQEYEIDKDTIQLKLLFLESDFFIELKNKATDDTYKISKKEIQLLFLNSLVDQENFDTSKLIEAISDIEFVAKEDFLKGFVQKPIADIEKKIEEAKNKRKANKANSVNIGETLDKQTSENLKQLKSILGSSNIKYASIADKVANEILQCSIDFFNHYQEIESGIDCFEPALKLAKKAEAIAIGKLTKDRIVDSKESLEEMKEREISQGIQLLQSIKDSYEENERKIKKQIKELEETDFEIRLGRRTINHRAVEESIKNSIDWQKVNELLVSVLTDNNLKKIKESDNNKLKNEFLESANWLKENSQKSSTITSIINKYKKIPPKLPFKIISSDVTNTDNKPLYTKYIRYIGLNLNVQVTEPKSVTFYIKFINPDGSLKRNLKTSPSVYSYSDIQNINLLIKSIKLLGWGNSDKCIYDIGKHRIEVYVDEYMIHSKDFVVDLAPSEKLEIELKTAEDKMKEINNIQYFKSEISSAQNEMSKIKEWQLFRSQSDRIRQIYEQQQKINNLIKSADSDKASQLSKQQSIINEIKSKIHKAEY